jgi:hypothetical protein
LCPGIFGTLLAQNAVFGCVPVSTKKKKIGSSFRRIELNTVQFFCQKCIHSLFWILAQEAKKKTPKSQKILTYTTKNLA